MPNNYFIFKQFTINQDRCAFKVGTDGVLLGAWADVTGARKILDIGTGTGLIALMLAQRSDAEIIAIEPDRQSFEQACMNTGHSRWAERIHVINSDLQGYDPGETRFDLIVTNPPYFTGSLKNPDKPKAAARHDVSLNYNELSDGIIRLMEENGRFVIILPFNEGNIFTIKAREYGLVCNKILKIKPLPSSSVKRLILTFSKYKHDMGEEDLIIENGRRHEFTEDYKSLTGDFYLDF
jgi:tRNA1Val (adenine37-N6)-methyltransferase